jgi:predicted metalloprotease
VKWRRGKRGPDVIDRRGARAGGGGFPIPIGRMGGGGIGSVLIALVIYLVFIRGGGSEGFDIPGGTDVFPQVPATGQGGDSVPKGPDPEREQLDFVSFVFTDVQGFWAEQFAAAGKPYENAKLIVYRSATNTGCGQGSSAIGPFYCPIDRQVYLDLGFFDELNRRFQAPGDFAQAYVVAHEVGHHVQQQLGIDQEVRRQSNENPDDANDLSVRLELQADCLAGVWGRSTYDRGILENGDLQEGLSAAAAVGDDRIQAQTQGQVNPETWTHGSSAQRQRWFLRGYQRGRPGGCNTFSGRI